MPSGVAHRREVPTWQDCWLGLPLSAHGSAGWVGVVVGGTGVGGLGVGRVGVGGLGVGGLGVGGLGVGGLSVGGDGVTAATMLCPHFPHVLGHAASPLDRIPSSALQYFANRL